MARTKTTVRLIPTPKTQAQQTPEQRQTRRSSMIANQINQFEQQAQEYTPDKKLAMGIAAGVYYRGELVPTITLKGQPHRRYAMRDDGVLVSLTTNSRKKCEVALKEKDYKLVRDYLNRENNLLYFTNRKEALFQYDNAQLFQTAAGTMDYIFPSLTHWAIAAYMVFVNPAPNANPLPELRNMFLFNHSQAIAPTVPQPSSSERQIARLQFFRQRLEFAIRQVAQAPEIPPIGMYGMPIRPAMADNMAHAILRWSWNYRTQIGLLKRLRWRQNTDNYRADWYLYGHSRAYMHAVKFAPIYAAIFKFFNYVKPRTIQDMLANIYLHMIGGIGINSFKAGARRDVHHYGTAGTLLLPLRHLEAFLWRIVPQKPDTAFAFYLVGLVLQLQPDAGQGGEAFTREYRRALAHMNLDGIPAVKTVVSYVQNSIQQWNNIPGRENEALALPMIDWSEVSPERWQRFAQAEFTRAVEMSEAERNKRPTDEPVLPSGMKADPEPFKKKVRLARAGE